jgi:hypothetical protein
MVVQQRLGWVRTVVAVGMAFRPLVVTLGIAAAAALWPAHAHADVGEPGTSASTAIGIGNDGPVSTALAGIGQSICPMLVQPGGRLASLATQMSGHDGLAPTIAGFVASTAIQTQCPSWMTSLANGDMPAGLQALTSLAGPALGLPNAPTSALPFGLPGAPASPLPFALPGANVSPSPFQVPGL